MFMWLIVVYFDQHLGAAHSKRWSKSSFLTFLLQKTLKKQGLNTSITLIIKTDKLSHSDIDNAGLWAPVFKG